MIYNLKTLRGAIQMCPGIIAVILIQTGPSPSGPAPCHWTQPLRACPFCHWALQVRTMVAPEMVSVVEIYASSVCDLFARCCSVSGGGGTEEEVRTAAKAANKLMGASKLISKDLLRCLRGWCLAPNNYLNSHENKS